MSKAKRRKGRNNKKQHRWRPQAQPTTTSKTKLFFSRGVWAVGILASFVGIYSFWVPRLSVSVLTALEPSAPLSTQFAISNDGYLAIYDVTFVCGVEQLKFKAGSGIERIGFTNPKLVEKRIGPSKKATVTCDWLINRDAPISKGDISIIVTFRPSWYPLQKNESFRFITVEASDGTLHWIPKPEESN